MSRICIVRHYYYPEDPRSRREAEALAAAGHEVDLISLRQPGEPAREVINGVNVRRLPVGHYRRSKLHYAYEYSAFFTLVFFLLAARILRRRYDVVQVNSLPDFLIFAAAPGKVRGARLVLDMHECTPELYCTKFGVTAEHPVVRMLAWVEQRSLAFADKVVTCTPQQKAIFASRGTPPGKIAVVLNAANSAIFRPRSQEPVLWQPGERFELVTHGLVVQRYGHETMVRAVALLAQELPDVVLHVYGKGDYLPELGALAQELGVGDKVIAHGFVPEVELLDGIARAHVGVIAAKRDSFRDLTHTQKMYEYVAMHKPVVIAETPAIRTHFDESCFQFFTSEDAADLARALRELYYNPSRAVTMVESAGIRYRAYDWDSQRHVYCEVVIGTVPQYAPGHIVTQEPIGVPQYASAVVVSQEPMAHVPTVPQYATPIIAAEGPSVHVGSLAETPLAGPPTEMGGLVAPIEEVGS